MTSGFTLRRRHIPAEAVGFQGRQATQRRVVLLVSSMRIKITKQSFATAWPISFTIASTLVIWLFKAQAGWHRPKASTLISRFGNRKALSSKVFWINVPAGATFSQQFRCDLRSGCRWRLCSRHRAYCRVRGLPGLISVSPAVVGFRVS